MKMLHRFLKDESGATAIEYGLIAALISVVIIGAVAALGDSLFDSSARSSPNLAEPASKAPCPECRFPATSSQDARGITPAWSRPRA